MLRFAERSAGAFVASVIYHDEHRPRVLLNGDVGDDGPKAAPWRLLDASRDIVRAKMAGLGQIVGEGSEPPPCEKGRLTGGPDRSSSRGTLSVGDVRRLCACLRYTR